MIHLLRHGQTEFNLEGRYQGGSDSPLTARGVAQARDCAVRLAAHLVAPQIWTSPLPRAARTAQILAEAMPGAAVRTDARLRELSFGDWDGMTRAEIAAGWPMARKAHPPRQWMFHAPGGERLEPFRARLAAVLADAAAQPDDVVLVSHAISGRLLRGLHAGLPLDQAVQLDAAQERVFRLLPGGGIAEL